ncbi:MAG: TetR/AcrR family transcriptional regulator [Pelomonas sp.]|nr:TetR/AcrR family transcriptional regulator [Roseateles sp.]
MRSDLLQAAMELFAQGGVEAVSVRGVATRIGVSAMAPYRYFASRADLLHGLWRQVIGELHGHLCAATVHLDNPMARHRALIRAYFNFWELRRSEFQLVYETQGLEMHAKAIPQVDLLPYNAILQLGRGISADVAKALGQSATHVALATDLRVALMFGFMQANMVNRRYPWSDMAALKETCIEQIACAVERVLQEGGSPVHSAAAMPVSP